MTPQELLKRLRELNQFTDTQNRFNLSLYQLDNKYTIYTSIDLEAKFYDGVLISGYDIDQPDTIEICFDNNYNSKSTIVRLNERVITVLKGDNVQYEINADGKHRGTDKEYGLIAKKYYEVLISESNQLRFRR